MHHFGQSESNRYRSEERRHHLGALAGKAFLHRGVKTTCEGTSRACSQFFLDRPVRFHPPSAWAHAPFLLCHLHLVCCGNRGREKVCAGLRGGLSLACKSRADTNTAPPGRGPGGGDITSELLGNLDGFPKKTEASRQALLLLLRLPSSVSLLPGSIQCC